MGTDDQEFESATVPDLRSALPGRRGEDYDRLLDQKDNEIERLHRRVEQMVSLQTALSSVQDLERRHGDLRTHVVKLDHALFGVTGGDGLVHEVKSFREGIAGIDQKIEKMRQEEFLTLKSQLQGTKDSIRNWALGLLPVLITLLGAAVAIISALNNAPVGK